MITREQAVYKIQRVREITRMLKDGSMGKMHYCDKINIVQELREIERDLKEYRRENPNA